MDTAIVGEILSTFNVLIQVVVHIGILDCTTALKAMVSLLACYKYVALKDIGLLCVAITLVVMKLL